MKSLSSADERLAAESLLLLVLLFGPGPVEHFEESGSLGAHPLVDVGLAALDVVVQVVPEQVDQVDGVLPRRRRCVPGEEHERHVPDVVTHCRVRLVLKFRGRVAMAVQDLWASLVPAASFFELLCEQRDICVKLKNKNKISAEFILVKRKYSVR